MPDRSNILHISDLHYCDTDDYDISVVMRALKERLIEITERYGALNFVMITGDVAKEGKSDQYDRAFDLITDNILEPLGMSDRVLVVPGNHDLDRAVVKANEAFYRLN